MNKYHSRTLDMLSGEGTEFSHAKEAELIEWGNKQNISIPKSVFDWAGLNGQAILEKYGNDHWFDFKTPAIVTTANGERGLRFESENQNNFDKIVLLDFGDDPPVLFGWLGKAPWVKYADKFSEAIFAQIFDWQFRLGFDHGEKHMVYSGRLDLLFSAGIEYLKKGFVEFSKTNASIESDLVSEFRFWKSPEERIIAYRKNESAQLHLEILGSVEKCKAFENELLLDLGDHVAPISYRNLSTALMELERHLNYLSDAKIRQCFLEKPTDREIAQLKSCNQEMRLLRRAQAESKLTSISDLESDGGIGGESWGVRLYFQQSTNSKYCIQRVELCLG